MAYRERPTVVHFAGHGNDRSLSIIQDHGLVANETCLTAGQLCDVLRTMQERVRLFVLNACLSSDLAQQLVDADVVDYAIGWRAMVSDSVAIAFSRALYASLGDGRRIGDAVAIARNACGTPDEPILAVGEHSGSDVLLVGARGEG